MGPMYMQNPEQSISIASHFHQDPESGSSASKAGNCNPSIENEDPTATNDDQPTNKKSSTGVLTVTGMVCMHNYNVM